MTGARGFVGRHVTAALAGRGCEVHAVSSAPGAGGGAIWHRANLLDAADREALVKEASADWLVHLAWHAKPPDYWRHPDNLRWTAASLDLVRAFGDRGGTRVVGAGTCAEYDWSQGHCSERTTSIAPSSLYGAAKAGCGLVLDAYGRETGLSLAWARLFFLFGPHDSPARLVPSLVLALCSGQPARCATGSHVRDFLYVADAAGALVALLESGVTGFVNIASGDPTQVGALARGIAERTGRPDLLTIDEGPVEDRVVTADMTRLTQEVGWHPHVDPSTALDDTVRWWCAAAGRMVNA